MHLDEAGVSFTGLSSEEARRRLSTYGKNELLSEEKESRFLMILRLIKDPMGLMLLGLAVIYVFLGERTDAIILLIAYVPITAIDVILGAHAERAIGKLKSTFRPTAQVFRDGALTDVSILELVPGDVMALEEGQTIPADGTLSTTTELRINEASLTGESEPLRKQDRDDLSAGTSVLSGRGVLEVTATGPHTKFGKILVLLRASKEELSPLQRKIHHLIKLIIRIASVLVVILFGLEIFRGKPFLQALLSALTFGMAAVPEEFPLVFTLYLSLGAWRLARGGVLVKSLPAVETLGGVDVICTDKTGTLTEGKFRLTELIPYTSMETNELWEFAILACEPIITDSMEKAIFEKAPARPDVTQWTLVHDYPFETDGKHMSHGWRGASQQTLLTMKGAVEGVLAHCRLTAEEKQTILNRTIELASQGYRLLGLAGKHAPLTGLRPRDEEGLTFLGIMAFSDPIRSSAKAAIQTCQREGIVVKMITGDHPLTAHAVADQLELAHSHAALYSGADLLGLSHEARQEAFRTGAIFSRVTPEQKYELVQALKDQGKIIAMTGDGVNDTPALKIADVGISMGDTATDAARATSKLVLLQNDFDGIVQAVLEGRRIFSSLRKSFSYLVSFHVPIVLLAFLPPALGMGDVFLPIHIILLHLVVHPVSAFTFENHPVVKQNKSREVLDKTTFLTAILSGSLVTLTALAPFFFYPDWQIEQKRSFSINVFLIGNLGFVLLETIPIFTTRLFFTVFLLLSSTLIFYLNFMSKALHVQAILPIGYLVSSLLGLGSSLPSLIIRKSRNA